MDGDIIYTLCFKHRQLINGYLICNAIFLIKKIYNITCFFNIQALHSFGLK